MARGPFFGPSRCLVWPTLRRKQIDNCLDAVIFSRASLKVDLHLWSEFESGPPGKRVRKPWHVIQEKITLLQQINNSCYNDFSLEIGAELREIQQQINHLASPKDPHTVEPSKLLSVILLHH